MNDLLTHNSCGSLSSSSSICVTEASGLCCGIESCIGGKELLLLLRCLVLGPPCGCCLVPSQVQGRAAVLLEVQGRVGPPLAAISLMLLEREFLLVG